MSLGPVTDLVERHKSVISRHIKSVFEEGEIEPEATVANFATVQREGDREVAREVQYFHLDVIISVGYRVKSHRGTQFRVWATQRLREYIIKCFTLDNERLKRWGGGYSGAIASYGNGSHALVLSDLVNGCGQASCYLEFDAEGEGMAPPATAPLDTP